VIVGLCGSNRVGSTNHWLLDAASRVIGDGGFVVYDGIVSLPQFSPDDDDEPPSTVLQLRALIAAADGVVISTPEYAHGIPGSLKNVLDWLVSTTVLDQKPTIVWSASPTGGEFVHPQLIEVLRTMSANVLVGASLQLVGPRRMFDAAGILIDPICEAQITDSLHALRAAIAA
jgi:chromate reductase, NAD(P)H dehydrogenase (quinone)